MTDLSTFIRAIDAKGTNGISRAKAILWWIGREDHTVGMDAREICRAVENCGHPKQNDSRLDTQLSDDKDVARVPNSRSWRLHPRARSSLDVTYQELVGVPAMVPETDSVVPRSLFVGTRGYLERVVRQINASYDAGLYDCCAVMCRRLLETLIIEVYEQEGRASAIKKDDSRFHMFGELLRIISSDPAFNLGRNAKKGLEDFKRLGDSSAHDRRFNARQSDIDFVRAGMRSSSEELLHLAHLI